MTPGPAFRVPPEAARRVGTVDVLLASVVAYAALPCASGLLAGMVGWIADLAGVGADTVVTQVLGLLFLSGMFAWMTAIFAVPAALVCTAHGFVGWASAALGGALAAQSLTALTIAGVDELGADISPEGVSFLALIGALYALAGWAFLRWRRPEVFAASASA